MWLTDKLLRKADEKGPPGEIMVFPIQGHYNHPEWTECFVVQDKKTMAALGFVGRIGYGETWDYDDGTGRAKGRGRVNGRMDGVSGRDLAVAKIYEVAQI